MAPMEFSVFVGNLSDKVTDDVLHEMFLQAGPVVRVNIPSSQGKQKPFGFVHFKHAVSVQYAISLMEGVSLYGKSLQVAVPRGASAHMPPRFDHPSYHSSKPMAHPLSHRGYSNSTRELSSISGRSRSERSCGEDMDAISQKRKSRVDNSMMPSARSKRNQSPISDQLAAIPDYLDSGFDPSQSYDSRAGSFNVELHHQRHVDIRRPDYSDRSHRQRHYHGRSGNDRERRRDHSHHDFSSRRRNR